MEERTVAEADARANDDTVTSATARTVRIGPDGSALVGRKRVQFGRTLAGATVTVQEA